MNSPRTPRQALQTTCALVALTVTTLLAPATSAVASPTRQQPPRSVHALIAEAVLPSDPRQLDVTGKGGEPK
jgi:hypothetical protein